MSSIENTENALHTMCSPKIFIEIVKGLTTKQRECIEDMGFGVLLNINCLVLHLPLCEMLLKSIAPEKKEIVLHGKSIPMRESDFEKVMGLPNGTEDVKCDMGEFDETCIRMKKILIKKSKNAITLSSLMKKLKNMQDADDVFRISFVLFTISSLLCPPESSKVNEALLTQLKDPRLIRHKKWATYCFLYLMDGVRKLKEGVSRSFQGCIPFLQIFYWGCISQKQVYVNRVQVPLVAWSENKAAALHNLVAKDNFFYSSTVEVDEPYWAVKHQGVEHEVENLKVKVASIEQSVEHLSSIQKHVEVQDLVETAIAPKLEMFKLDMLKLITKQPNEDDHVASHKKEVIVISSSTESLARSPYLTRQKTQLQRSAEKKQVQVGKSKVEIHLKPDSRRTRRRLLFHSNSPISSFSDDDIHLLNVLFGDLTKEKQSEAVIENEYLCLTRKDVQENLLPKNWFNETLINMALYNLNEDTSTNVWYLSTYFSVYATTNSNIWLPDLSSVERVSFLHLYKGNEKLCDKIFIPINDSNQHWFLLVINVSSKIAEVWDSLPVDKENIRRLESAKIVLTFLDQWFLECRNLNMNFKSFTVNASAECPIQPNLFDCGLFLIANCKHGSKSWLNQTKYNSEYYRFKLALDLAKHHTNKLLPNLKATSLPEQASFFAVPPKTPAFPAGEPKATRPDHKAKGIKKNIGANDTKAYQLGWISRRRSR